MCKGKGKGDISTKMAEALMPDLTQTLTTAI